MELFCCSSASGAGSNHILVTMNSNFIFLDQVKIVIYFAQFSAGLPVPTQDLFQLQKYLEEASHREQLLESKLAALQRLVADTRTCSAESWRALVEEDRSLTTSTTFVQIKLCEWLF